MSSWQPTATSLTPSLRASLAAAALLAATYTVEAASNRRIAFNVSLLGVAGNGTYSVYATRQRMGRRLARESSVEADVVIPVPDSGVAAASGYAGGALCTGGRTVAALFFCQACE